MSVPKKEALVVLLLIGVILLMGGFFLQLESGNGLTGAAVSNIGNVVAVPDVANNSSQIVKKNSSPPMNIELDNEVDTSFSTIQQIGDGKILVPGTNLSTSDIIFNGVAASESGGKAVAFGDLNGDGYTDFVVGAPDATANSVASAGKVYIYYGRSSLAGTFNLSTANVTILGANGGAGGIQLGSALAVGDFNNDSIADLFIGAEYGGSDAKGRVYAIFGSSSIPSTIDLATESRANITFSGINQTSHTGASIVLGDINGDRVKDVVIGSPSENRFSSYAYSGEVYVVFGRPTPLTSYNLLTQVNVTFWVNSSTAYLGDRRGLAIGDISRDGIDDLFISGTNNNGGSYVVYGFDTITGNISLSTKANYTLDFTQSNSMILADINNDGVLDLIQGDETDSSNNGYILVYYGSSANLTGTRGYSDRNLSIIGSNAERFGYDLATGDYDNDGIIDLFVSAPYADNHTATDKGVIYLFYGPINFTGTQNTLNSGKANVTFNGIDATDYAGTAFVAGDINKDSFADLFVGAYGGDPNSNSQAGEAYVSYGKVGCSILYKNTTLNQNLYPSGNCFTINTSSIVLDGKEYVVAGSNSGVAINVSNAMNVTLKNLRIWNFSSAIYLELSSNNTFVQNSRINGSTYDVWINANGGGNTTLLNVTFNRTKVQIGENSDIKVKWYVDVYVNDTSGNALNLMNVSGYNVTGGGEQSILTDTSGNARFSLIEFMRTNTTIFYYTNHTLNVTGNLYNSSQQRNFNLSDTNSTRTFFTMSLNCGTLLSSTTFSRSTIEKNGDCFKVGASNIFLEGAGLTIRGNGSGIGFNNTGYNNVTVRNVVIHNFSSAIFLQGANNSNFSHVVLNASADKDIYVIGWSVNTTFINTTFDRDKVSVLTNSNISVRWFVTTLVQNANFLVSNANISLYDQNNNFIRTELTGSQGLVQWMIEEFYQDSINGRTFFTPHNFTFNKTQYYVTNQSVNLTRTNSTFLTFDVEGKAVCGDYNTSILLRIANITTSVSCFNITSNNTIINGSALSVVGPIPSLDTTIIGLSTTNRQNISLDRFIFSNLTYGVSLNNSKNITLTNFNIFNNTYGVYMGSGSAQNTIKDSIIAYSKVQSLVITSGTNHILTNVSMDKNNITSGDNTNMVMRWYTTINVSDTSGNALSGVTLSAYKADGSVETTANTSDSGTARLTLSEFSKDEFGYTYITPHTIKAVKAGYFENSTVVDVSISNNTVINFTLVKASCGINLVKNITLGENMHVNGTCFNLSSNSISIDGNNYLIIGNGTGTAIDFYDKKSITISNLNIQNFSKGINLYLSSDLTFRHINITNSSYGVFFNNSNNNSVYDSFFQNNTVSIYSINDGGTNNTLINVSINLNDIVVEGTATVFKKWYVTVNTTFGAANYALANANVTGRFNSTQKLDDSRLTQSNGAARLELTELKKNSSEVYYYTPHNITAFFSSTLSGYTENITYVNITQTNNTIIQLYLPINCTAPYDDLQIERNTLLCPGTYEIADGGSYGVIRMGWPNESGNLTCDNTIIKGTGTGVGINIRDVDNVKISGCTVRDYATALQADNSCVDNVNISNFKVINVDTGVNAYLFCNNFNMQHFSFQLNTNGVGLKDLSGTDDKFILRDGTFTGYRYGLDFTLAAASWTNGVIDNVTFTGDGSTSSGIYKMKGTNNTIKNSTFVSNKYGIYLDTATGSYIYHNIFTSSSTYHIYNLVSTDNNYFNTSINNVGQGNQWSNYCSLSFTDSDSNGWADSGSNYPYNSTNSGLFSGFGNDYGPKVVSCPVTSAVGAAAASAASAASASGGGAAAAAPSAPAATATTSASAGSNGGGGGGEFYSAADVKKFLKTSEGAFESKKSEQGLEVYVVLENTGDKPMKISPIISQEVDDPYFMLTRKTLGGENSGLQTIAKLSYSKNPIAGTLLKAILVNAEEIVIPPGGKVEKALQVKEGFGSTKPLKIQFSSLGETVLEKDVKVERKAISAAAVDTHENYVDIYAILVPDGAEKTEGVIVGSELTGAAILDKIPVLANGNSPYFLELSLNKKNKFGKLHTVFTDQYGPYPLKQKESFLFAQQLKYDSEVYNGDYVVETKMYHGPALMVKNEFDVMLGAERKDTIDGFWLWIGLLAIIGIFLAQGLYFMNVYYRN